MKSMADLVEAFGIGRGDLVALVGGGGKTSLLFAIGRTFPGRVVLTTTTHLFEAQTGLAEVVLRPGGWERLEDVLVDHKSCLVVGESSDSGEKVGGVPLDRPRDWLARPGVDLVVVEADGSRRRPVKAPAAHEPALPEGVTLVIVVAGIDALSGPIAQVAHRPERVCALTGLRPADSLTPAALAGLLAHEEGGGKDVPSGGRVVVCLNKVDTPAERALAEEVAGSLRQIRPGVPVVLTTCRAAGACRVVAVL